MDLNETRFKCLELSCFIARDIGYLSEHRWKSFDNQQKLDVFKTIFTMADDFSDFVLKEIKNDETV